MLNIWPAIDRDPDFAHTLRENTTALYASSDDSLLHPNAHALLFRNINSFGLAGRIPTGSTFGQLPTDMQRVLGPDHPDTLAVRNNLAFWRGEGGDPAGAAIAFEQLLADYLRLFGPDHPDTLTARHNLASWRGEAGTCQGIEANGS
ncbi:tetratricopeptide repeat protein [Micromonospora sp. NPDC000316]|uniref:tetratricopeptide repeat protein n=1 Tax=Micromonospora sp. NPDC000316 TaxID=3364216 RepID=UPI0036AB88C8